MKHDWENHHLYHSWLNHKTTLGVIALFIYEEIVVVKLQISIGLSFPRMDGLFIRKYLE